jgi:Raf kinase inhibitor-like YbhB/YbcL family protein
VRALLPIAAAAALLAGCGGGEKAGEPLPPAAAALRLASPAFPAGGRIPERFTCDGEDVSPPLAWTGPPAKARELALVVEDPDADRFVHWTVLRMPPRTRGLAEGRTPPGAIETENSFGKRGWGGPCPPEGDDPHRYVFALYASRRPLGLGGDATPDEVRDALAADALARGTLTGRFGR